MLGVIILTPHNLNPTLITCSWIEAAGGALEDPEEGVTEVSALVSYCGEGLEEVAEGRTFKEAYELDLQVWNERGVRISVDGLTCTLCDHDGYVQRQGCCPHLPNQYGGRDSAAFGI